ncbi:hypothetical protein Dimus_011123 [Dionaea muscipula]
MEAIAVSDDGDDSDGNRRRAVMMAASEGLKIVQLFDDWKEEIRSSSCRSTTKTTMPPSGSNSGRSQGVVVLGLLQLPSLLLPVVAETNACKSVEFCSNEDYGGSQWAAVNLWSIEVTTLTTFSLFNSDSISAMTILSPYPSNSLLLWHGVDDGGSQWAAVNLWSIEVTTLTTFSLFKSDSISALTILSPYPSNSLLLWRGIGGWTDVVECSRQ